MEVDNLFNENKTLNPYQLYRKLRPEYFSDSKVERQLTREMFEFTMSNLSKNMKQDLFEDMTRRLASKLITPNLIPQTGPTGGGDGKTDIETHPIDDAISCKWFYSEPCNGKQKWAFAISCKTDWLPKIKSDVKKIVDTKRGFTKIFFCTNQLVPSKQKATLQDQFKKLYHIEVIILDLNWYIQSVFDNDGYDIAITSLNLSPELKEVKVEGPNDKRKNLELAEVNERINNAKLVGKLNTRYIEDLLSAAILSRELELPTNNIKERFSIALSQAKVYGTPQQVYNIIYQIGWTDFYWFEDPESMYEQYVLLKQMLNKEINVNRLEKAFNLRNLTQTAINCKLFNNTPDINAESEYWQELFKKVENDDNHKSSALYLRICLLELDLISLLTSKDNIDNKVDLTLTILKNALLESTSHLDIPFDSLAYLLSQMGIYIKDNSTYEDIIDVLAEEKRKRYGDIEAAKFHYDRGVQNIEQGDYMKAIKHLGQCIVAFQKEPTRTELVRACGMLAYTYQQEDILYSSKVFYVKSLSLLYHQLETEGTMDHLILTFLYELCKIDIRLGQINSFLNWLNMSDFIVYVYPALKDKDFDSRRSEIDALLAINILSSDDITEKWEVLPTIFQRAGLSVSEDVSYYKLGYNEKVSKEFKENIMTDKDWKERVQGLANSGASLFQLELSTKQESHYSTLIHGCRINAVSRSTLETQACVETLLAEIESLLITLGISDLAIATPVVNLKFKTKNGGKTEVKGGSSSTDYDIKINLSEIDEEHLWNLCAHFLAFFLTRNSMSKDIEKLFNSKAKEEKLNERLAIVCSYYKDLKNCIGIEYKSYIDLWIEKGAELFPPKFNDSRTDTENKTSNNRGKQSQQLITDLIDYPMWNMAQWSGCGYIMAYDGSEPPILVFMYKHFEPAYKIFEKWENDFRNKKLNIKLTFITGVNSDHPKWYKVIVSPDIEKIFKSKENNGARYVITGSRFHLMRSEDGLNLSMFKTLVSKFHFAGISACEMVNNQMSQERDKCYPRVIPVTNIEFREAWTIGVNDSASMAILSEDKPIIPIERKNDAPVVQLLKTKKNEKL